MGTVIAILQLLPAIISAFQAVEAAIPIPQSGATKLNLVLDAILSVGNVAENLIPAIKTVIASIVSTFNAVGIFKTTAKT